MTKKLGLLSAETVIALSGTKEMSVTYDALAEGKYHLVIRDGGGVKTIPIEEDLYNLLIKFVRQ